MTWVDRAVAGVNRAVTEVSGVFRAVAGVAGVDRTLGLTGQ